MKMQGIQKFEMLFHVFTYSGYSSLSGEERIVAGAHLKRFASAEFT